MGSLLSVFFLYPCTKPYQEPVLWRRDIIIAIILVCLLLLILALLFIGWCAKSNRRKEEVFTKKQYIRESLRRQKDRSFRNQQTSENGNTIFVNEQNISKNSKDQNKFKPIQAHSPMVAINPKKKGGSRTSESTSTTTGDQTYSTPTDTTRTCTDSFCTDNYTETTYTAGKNLPS
uniref:Uncharacterized protein n=1 Tax=Panagrolaimus davidi TaxID=227884 RepID=A0A914QMW6_9BILA